MLKRFVLNGIFAIAVLGAAAQAQYKIEAAGAPPPEAAAIGSALAKEGVKILKDDGSVLCEIWLVAQPPSGGSAEDNVSLPQIRHGALIGLASYPSRFSDRRGQTIKPGVYTLRYSRFPMNGDHMGVSPQRDFLILSPAASDTNAAAAPDFNELMAMSRKASGTPHPLVLSFWKDDSADSAGIEASGENEQVLHISLGGLKIAIMIAGRFEG